LEFDIGISQLATGGAKKTADKFWCHCCHAMHCNSSSATLDCKIDNLLSKSLMNVSFLSIAALLFSCFSWCFDICSPYVRLYQRDCAESKVFRGEICPAISERDCAESKMLCWDTSGYIKEIVPNPCSKWLQNYALSQIQFYIDLHTHPFAYAHAMLARVCALNLFVFDSAPLANTDYKCLSY
jgi:hypothetical protein